MFKAIAIGRSERGRIGKAQADEPELVPTEVRGVFGRSTGQGES
jgi:hypothetical protein